jgi:hypothetical protein
MFFKKLLGVLLFPFSAIKFAKDLIDETKHDSPIKSTLLD